MAASKNSRKLSHSQINAGDEIFDVCCNSCTKKHLNEEASKYCTGCEEYLCVSCVIHHNSFEKLSRHSLVDPHVRLPTARRSRSSLHVAPTEMCKKHHLNFVDMFCEDDNMVGCSVCMTLEHKSCVHLHYIPEYVQTNSPTGQLRQIKTDLTKAIQAMNKLQTENDSLDTILDTSKAACQQEIQKYRDDINQIIDMIEASTLADLGARYKDKKKKVNGTNKKIQEVHQELVRCKSEMESDQSNESQKFVLAKLSKCTISLGQELESELAHDQTNLMTFSRNTDIMTFLLSIVTLGILCPSGTTSKQQLQQSQSVKYPTKKTQSYTSPPTTGDNKITDNKLDQKVVKKTLKPKQNQGTTVAKQPLKQGLYKVSDQRKFSIEHPDDKNDTCSSWSSIILDNGNILLADFKNTKLKQVDSRSYKIRSTLTLGAAPISVCRVNSTQAAVCLNDCTIQFISISDKLQLLHSFQTKDDIYHVACIRDTMCACSDTVIYISTPWRVNLLTVRKNKSGHDMFTCILGMTVSDRNLIHVSDRDHGVVTLNIEGDVVWTFSRGTELGGPGGLCTDEDGNVIVCDYVSHTVIQLSPDGLYMGQVVTHDHGVKYPRRVCLDRHNHKLFVNEIYNGNVKAFTLQ